MELITLAAENLGNVAENMSEYGVNVTLSGILIVFCMLVLLVIVISLFGFIMNNISGGAKKIKKVNEPKIERKAELPVAPVATATSSEENEIVAAISAAVMMMYEGTGKTPVIRSIRPAQKGVRSAWATAGVMNNTRGF